MDGHYPRKPAPPLLPHSNKIIQIAMFTPPAALGVLALYLAIIKSSMGDSEVAVFLGISIACAVLALTQARKVQRATMIVCLSPLLISLVIGLIRWFGPLLYLPR